MVEEISYDKMDIQTGPRIEKFKFAEGEQQVKKRVWFSTKVWKETVSFKENYGYFKFIPKDGQEDLVAKFGDQVGIKSFVRYGTHILKYHTTLEGNLKTPFSYSIEALIKTEKAYAKIYGLHQLYSQEFFKNDFLVTLEGQLKFQNMNFNFIPGCAWMKQPNKNDILADIKSKMEEFNLAPIIAPSISYDTLKALIEGKLPNRFATKNQDVVQTGIPVNTGLPTVEVQPFVPNQPVANQATASKSDLDLLNELSK